MQLAVQDLPKLPGKTIVLVDVSGSMVGTKISQKSELDRLDAAAALATLIDGLAEQCQVYTFSNRVVTLPPRHGMALIDAIRKQDNGGTQLGSAVKQINREEYDRLIVTTDEQSHDSVGAPKGHGYMINVGSYKNGVSYETWTRLTGFSEALVQWIQASESLT
jgi:hypothetical protein